MVKVKITLKTNVLERLGRSSREDRVKNATVREIMRHKWLSEDRKLQWVDQMLMTEKWKQPKQLMKGELRSSKSARLFTVGLRCFEAKDTVRKVFRRGKEQVGRRRRWSQGPKTNDTWHRQRPKGAWVLCAGAGSATKAKGTALSCQCRIPDQRECELQSSDKTDHPTGSKV